MTTITDFQDFIDNLNSRHIDDIHSLYQSIVDVDEVGSFNCKRNKDGRLFISDDQDDFTLMLSSEKSKNAFLSKLDIDFGGDFGSIYGHYEFQRAMDKND